MRTWDLRHAMEHLPSENDSSSSLDVVVEALVAVAVPVEVVEGLLALKILELNTAGRSAGYPCAARKRHLHHVGVDLGGSLHELVHEFLLLRHGNALGAQTQVERVLQVGLIRGAAVEDDGQRLLRVDAGRGRVQSQLANLMRVSRDTGDRSERSLQLTGMPTPFTPRSPRPRIREPSVTTQISGLA